MVLAMDCIGLLRTCVLVMSQLMCVVVVVDLELPSCLQAQLRICANLCVWWLQVGAAVTSQVLKKERERQSLCRSLRSERRGIILVHKGWD